MIGPAVPVISKMKDIYRRVVYLKNYQYNELVALREQVENYVSENNKDQDFGIQFDMNPLNMY